MRIPSQVAGELSMCTFMHFVMTFSLSLALTLFAHERRFPINFIKSLQHFTNVLIKLVETAIYFKN